MCKAFSCIATKRKVYWKAGLDGHEHIKGEFHLYRRDRELDWLCPIEITPKNGNYLNPNKWGLNFDDGCPDWWKKSHEKMCWESLEKWKKEVYGKINLEEARKPINPFKLPMVKKVTEEQIKLLKEWISAYDSIGCSMDESVGDSIYDFIGDSIYNFINHRVWDSIGNSIATDVIEESLWAYFGSLFNLKRKEWEYTEKIKCKGYPFQCLVDLWKQGLVPSFDSRTWKLHSGRNAKVVYEMKAE